MPNPVIVAELSNYPALNNPRKHPIISGLRCPAFETKQREQHGWDCIITFDGSPIEEGKTRIAEFRFLSGIQAIEALAVRGVFFLWARGIFAEARIIDIKSSEDRVT